MLINNAGALFATRRTTEDGLECTFALNHMAYFVVTEGLRERLLASAPARIINTASAAHLGATLDFDDLQSAKSLHPGFVATRFGDESGALMSRVVWLAKFFAISPARGAQTIIYLASSPDVAKTTGTYFYKSVPALPSPAARDDRSALSLWQRSAALAGMKE